jgi:hypothetical protein
MESGSSDSMIENPPGVLSSRREARDQVRAFATAPAQVGTLLLLQGSEEL